MLCSMQEAFCLSRGNGYSRSCLFCGVVLFLLFLCGEKDFDVVSRLHLVELASAEMMPAEVERLHTPSPNYLFLNSLLLLKIIDGSLSAT